MRDAQIDPKGARILERAVEIADRLRWQLVPGYIKNGKQKSAAVPWDQATNNPSVLREFGGRWNGGLIMALTGRDVVCLDLDRKNGVDGVAAFDKLVQTHGPLPITYTARTPSGGIHYYFNPGDRRIRRSVGKIGPGIDVLGIGGVIVLPGSERPDGIYTWMPERAPHQTELATLPGWLANSMVEASERSRQAREKQHKSRGGFFWNGLANGHGDLPRTVEIYMTRAVDGMARDIAAAPNGEQEVTLNGRAFRLGTMIGELRNRGFHLTGTTIGAWQQAIVNAGATMTSYDPGWKWLLWEVEDKVNDALSAGLDHPGNLPGDMWPQVDCAAAHEREQRDMKIEPLTQDTVAREFIVQNKGELRFDCYRGRWHRWENGIWRCDERDQTRDEIRQFCARIDDPKKWRLGSASAIRGIEELARSDIDVTVTSSDWDGHSYILATPGCYIDLKTGLPFDPDPALQITQATTVALEDGEPELFLEFLYQATGGDADYMDFIQRALGYCLTGDIKEHCLFFIHGPGETGKSTLVNVVKEILGSYAWIAPLDMFTRKKFDGHPTDLASLRGRRLVVSNEVEQGKAWAEARIKALTGGDPVTARFMRQDNFTFDPTHKLIIVGNHAPAITNCDESMRRRFHVLPFEEKPQVTDLELYAKLVHEAGKILGYMIRGCLQWQQRGMAPPAIVKDATNHYFEAQDVFAQWLDEETTRQPSLRDSFHRLYTSYTRYMADHGEYPVSSRDFGNELKRRGFKRIQFRDANGKKVKGWQGLKALW